MEICKSTKLVIYATLFVSCMILLFVSVSVISAILIFLWPISCSLTEITQIAKQILTFPSILEKNWMWILIQTCKRWECTCGYGILTISVLKVFQATAGFVYIQFHPQRMSFEFWGLSWKHNGKLMRSSVCKLEILLCSFFSAGGRGRGRRNKSLQNDHANTWEDNWNPGFNKILQKNHLGYRESLPVFC